ncbi:hypothetical protein [Sulfuricurvum sp.]|uniref:hypothetical protein n=1 Tax=Sulfuricurvum sp. TaxID=2025608 RepID=UPI002D7451E8|nr:hypothetical protein [Sulfuricurvum sp.]HZF70104.1 hypothetical protein [Sulfuricurvum sp.]
MVTLSEFHAEVIEALCELGGCSEADAHALAEEKYSDIEYGHKYRLSSTIIAGSILGINDCCIPKQPIKR